MLSLNDNQCLILTHRLCETTSELYELLTDLLQTSASSINVTVDEHIEVSFPVHFGSRNRVKVWSFKVQLPHLSSTEIDSIGETSLDPLDWNETRSLGHQIMDDMIDYLRDVRLRPAWRPMPASVKQNIANSPLPLKGQSASEVYDEVRSIALPYVLGNIHPHYWGYVHGTGSPIGALAELITGTMNTMSWGGHQASVYLERQVLSWLKVLMGFPNDETCSGVLALQESIDPNSGGFIVGSAGTIGTGAIDDLQGLADLCTSRPNDLWFHVDGATGA
ncbi:unnamed protein product, partial [Rotaria sp. Silwood2]